MRITAGQYRSRRIHFPASDGLRPTPDRVRETLFNWLGQDLAGCRVLDLFAGSGILGMESLSRGAVWAGFVERTPRVARQIEENLDLLHVPPQDRTLWIMDARTWLERAEALLGAGGPVDVLFLDPPFAQPDLLEETLRALANGRWLSSGARVYLEHGRAWDEVAGGLPESWHCLRQGSAGESRFALYEVREGPC